MNFTEPRRLIGFRLQDRTTNRNTDIVFNSIAFHPGGQQIAFSLYSPKGAGIGLVDLVNGKVTRLVRSGLTKSGRPRDDTFWDLQFTPDGKHLLYILSKDDQEQHSLHLLDTVTTEQIALTQTDSCRPMRPHLSPDGQTIVFVSWDRGTANLCQIGVGGGAVTALTHSRSLRADPEEYHYQPGNIRPCYSPDGQYIAFLSSDYDGKTDDRLQVCTMRSDGTGVIRLTDFPGDCDTPVFHPEGKQIAFTTHAELPEGTERKKWKFRLNVYVVNRDGSEVRCLEDSDSVNHLGGFSPNGRYLVYSSSGEERFEEGRRNWDIRLLDTESGIVHRVTDDDCYNSTPVFHPDGKSILFVSERDGFVGIYQTVLATEN